MEKFNRVALNVLGRILNSSTQIIESLMNKNGRKNSHRLEMLVAAYIKDIMKDQNVPATELNAHISRILTDLDIDLLSELKRELREDYKAYSSKLTYIENRKSYRNESPKSTYKVIQDAQLNDDGDSMLLQPEISKKQKIHQKSVSKKILITEPEPEYLNIGDILLKIEDSVLEDSLEESPQVEDCKLSRRFEYNKSKFLTNRINLNNRESFKTNFENSLSDDIESIFLKVEEQRQVDIHRTQFQKEVEFENHQDSSEIKESINEKDVVIYKDLEEVFGLDLIQFSDLIHYGFPDQESLSKTDQLFEVLLLDQLKNCNLKKILDDENRIKNKMFQNDLEDDSESNSELSGEDQNPLSDNSKTESDEESELVPLFHYTNEDLGGLNIEANDIEDTYLNTHVCYLINFSEKNSLVHKVWSLHT